VSTLDDCGCGRRKPITHALCPACRVRLHRERKARAEDAERARAASLLASLSARAGLLAAD
jgi:hypothetical protein